MNSSDRFIPNRLNKAFDQNQKGIALVIVLWILALLSILALAYSGMTRTEGLLARNMVHTSQARALAESGFWTAVHDLIRPVPYRKFSVAGSPTTLYENEHNRVVIQIQDESGKIDINKASQRLLLGLFLTASAEPDQANNLVDAILDWRDRDNLRKVNGAEDQDYAALGLPYGAKDGTFNSIEELLLIRGMTAEIFDKIKPSITVHSMQARVRLNAAPKSVLWALPDMTEKIIDEILSIRSAQGPVIIPDILPASASPMVFTSGQGNVYTITCDARVGQSTSRLKVTLILRKTGNRPITILDWQEKTAPLIQEQTNSHDSGF